MPAMVEKDYRELLTSRQPFLYLLSWPGKITLHAYFPIPLVVALRVTRPPHQNPQHQDFQATVTMWETNPFQDRTFTLAGRWTAYPEWDETFSVYTFTWPDLAVIRHARGEKIIFRIAVETLDWKRESAGNLETALIEVLHPPNLKRSKMLDHRLKGLKSS